MLLKKEAYRIFTNFPRNHHYSEIRNSIPRGSWGKIEKEIQKILTKKRNRHQISSFCLRQNLLANAQRKLSQKLESCFPYRISESRWAGGRNNFSVKINRGQIVPELKADTYTEWSDNGKWRGNSVDFSLKLSPGMSFGVFGGLLTIFQKNSDSIFWFEQSRGFEVKLVEGYLWKGYHEKKRKNDTFERAKGRIHRKRQKAAESLKTQRMLNKPLSELNLPQIWVKRNDSIKAGNCPAGTDQFIKKLRAKIGNVGGIRADYLLELTDTSLILEAKKAIRYAFIQTRS